MNKIITIFSAIVSFIPLWCIYNNDFISGDWIAHYKLWIEQIKIYGIGQSISDYPCAFDLLLLLLIKMNAYDLHSFKLVMLLFSYLNAFAGYKIIYFYTKRKCLALYGYCCLILLPSVVLDVTIWGQTDLIYISLCSLAIYCVLRGGTKIFFLPV